MVARVTSSPTRKDAGSWQALHAALWGGKNKLPLWRAGWPVCLHWVLQGVVYTAEFLKGTSGGTWGGKQRGRPAQAEKELGGKVRLLSGESVKSLPGGMKYKLLPSVSP